MATPPEQGELNPEYVAKVEFNLSRRGYEPTEVRALLREVAQNLVTVRAREAAAEGLVADETDLTLEQLEAEFGLDRLAEVAVLRESAAPSDTADSSDETADELSDTEVIVLDVDADAHETDVAVSPA